jgi:hypothetical protein
MKTKTLTDTVIFEHYRTSAQDDSGMMPMLELVKVLRGKSYADEVLADKSHHVLCLETTKTCVTVEYWPHIDRFRIRFFQDGRKLTSHESSSLSETANLIDAYVIRARLAEASH